MNHESFLDAFGIMVEAPGGMDTLRAMILDLALRGRLTKASPTDQPASELLLQISSARTDRPAGRGGKATRGVRMPLVGAEATVGPYPIPEGWAWSRLGEVCESRLGKMLDDRKNSGSPRPYLRNTNVQWGRFDLGDIKQIRLEDNELEEYSLRAGDLLVVEGGEPARCAIWDPALFDGVMVFQKALHRVRPDGGVLARYIALTLRNGVDSGRIRELFTGSTIKHLTGEKLKNFVIPIPPTAEQHRIVQRVTELFALCDELEAQLADAKDLSGDVAASVATHTVSKLMFAESTAQ